MFYKVEPETPSSSIGDGRKVRVTAHGCSASFVGTLRLVHWAGGVFHQVVQMEERTLRVHRAADGGFYAADA